MASRAEPSKLTQLYTRLTEAQQKEFGKVVIGKLRTLIGGHGELSVLAEYIAVMLQSSRPPEQIQSELEAFLQEQSQPFTDWLCKQLVKHAGEEQRPTPDAKGEELLLRAVQDARVQGAAAAVAAPAEEGGGGRRREGGDRERRSKREAREAAAATEKQSRAAAAATERHSTRHRSRSRRRRRDKEGKKHAVLTPNVEFLRGAYHNKTLKRESSVEAKARAAEPAALPADERWSFRADSSAAAAPAPGGSAMHWHAEPGAGAPPAAPGAPVAGAPPGHHPGHHPGAPPPGHYPPQPYGYHPAHAAEAAPQPAPAPARPRHFMAKKWKVMRANTVVRATEHLNSEEVQLLQDGEIVEQVAPAFKLKNGIVRIQIRHPSSPQFPNPIGWVTQDASSAGGPKFLEPGPEPMHKGSWRPPPVQQSWGGGGPPMGGRPPRPGGPLGGKGAAPRAPGGAYGFQNLTWTPGKPAGTAAEPITIPG